MIYQKLLRNNQKQSFKRHFSIIYSTNSKKIYLYTRKRHNKIARRNYMRRAIPIYQFVKTNLLLHRNFLATYNVDSFRKSLERICFLHVSADNNT